MTASQTLSVGELSAAETRQLADYLWQQAHLPNTAQTRKTLQQLPQRAHGNPLFVEQLVHLRHVRYRLVSHRWPVRPYILPSEHLRTLLAADDQRRRDIVDTLADAGDAFVFVGEHHPLDGGEAQIGDKRAACRDDGRDGGDCADSVAEEDQDIVWVWHAVLS